MVSCNSTATIEVVGVDIDELLQSNSLVTTSGSNNMFGDISVCAFEFIPIGEAGFEDDDPASCSNNGGDGRDCWRQADLGGVIQITSSPVHSGDQGAKLPSDGTRIGYQRVSVNPNTEYILSFYYTMKDDPVGTLTVSILDDTVLTDPSEVAAAVIASTTVNDQSDPDTYVLESLIFNSGSLTEVAIFFSNESVECRLDDFSMVSN